MKKIMHSLIRLVNNLLWFMDDIGNAFDSTENSFVYSTPNPIRTGLFESV